MLTILSCPTTSIISRIKLKVKILITAYTNIAEAYYCTQNGKIKGVFTLTEHMIMFDPIICKENEQLLAAIKK